MKKIFIKICGILLTLLLITTIISTIGCASSTAETSQKQFVAASKGDLLVGVTADGNLSMPHEVKLRFGSPGTVKKIYVKEGDEVRAGTLLAKLDDTDQRIAVTAAQYDVEIALNQIALKVYPSLLGYPHYYPSFTALLRVEQAQEELENAMSFFEQGSYADAASELRIMYHDLEAGAETLQAPMTDLETYPDIAKAYLTSDISPEGSQYKIMYPAIPKALDAVNKDLTKLENIQSLIDNGEYQNANLAMAELETNLNETNGLVDNACGSIVRLGIKYPDASTSLTVLKDVEDRLNELQKMVTDDKSSNFEIAEKMRMALHDVEISRKVLEDNELLMTMGMNLTVLRQNNLNYQKAEVALNKAKDDLMKTEILAPFDGMVVKIDVKENDQLSAFDYSSRLAVHLVDTKTVQIDGVVDEVDIFKVKIGQKAIVTVDALPDQELAGEVTFISPFSTEVAGIVNYPVTIMLDPSDLELKGGLTATANIVVDSRENVLIIPNGAIKGSVNEYYVDVLIDREKNTTEKRSITIGIQNSYQTEVISGLIEGEEVAVERAKPTKSIF